MVIRRNYNNRETGEDDEYLQQQLNSAGDSVLGGFLKLSPGVRTAAKPLIARATTWISKQGSVFLAGGVAGVATFLGAKDPNRIRETSQKVLQYAIPFWEDIANGARTVHDHWSETRKLGKNIAPFLPEKDRKLTSVITSKNEIIQHARAVIAKNTKNNLASMSVNLLERLPQLYTAHYDQEITKLAKQHGRVNYRNEVDPEDLMDFLKTGEHATDLKKAGALFEKLKIAENYLTPGGSLAAAIAQEKGFGKKDGEQEGVSVLERIHDLKKQVDEMCSSHEGSESTDPERIASQIRQQVTEIFTAHQKDMGRGDIPKRLKDKLQDMIDLTTQAIADGDMSVGALLHLAGEGKLIVARGNKIKDIATSAAVKSEIRRMGELLPVEETVDVEAYFKEAPFSKEELKAIFQNTQGSERALLGTLFDKPILRSIELSDKEIRAFHKKTNAAVYEVVKNRIVAVNALSPEDKKKLNMTTEDAEHLAKWAAELEEDNPKALKRAVRDGAVKRILANAAVKGDKKLWTEVVRTAADAKQHNRPKEDREEPSSADTDGAEKDDYKKPSRKPASLAERDGIDEGVPFKERRGKDNDDSPALSR